MSEEVRRQDKAATIQRLRPSANATAAETPLLLRFENRGPLDDYIVHLARSPKVTIEGTNCPLKTTVFLRGTVARVATVKLKTVGGAYKDIRTAFPDKELEQAASLYTETEHGDITVLFPRQFNGILDIRMGANKKITLGVGFKRNIRIIPCTRSWSSRRVKYRVVPKNLSILQGSREGQDIRKVPIDFCSCKAKLGEVKLAYIDDSTFVTVQEPDDHTMSAYCSPALDWECTVS